MMLPPSVLSLALASIFFAMLRLRAPRWSYLVLGLLPPTILLLASPSLRVFPSMALLCTVVVVLAWRAGGPQRRLAALLTGTRGKPWAKFMAEWSQRKPPEDMLSCYGNWPDAKLVRPVICL